MRLPDETERDTELITAIAAGDRKAFAVFARRHVAKCLGVAVRIVGNSSDAEEVVQDAMLRVWQHAADWRGTDAQVTTWLYRIVINLAIDRRRKRRPPVVPIEEGHDAVDAGPTAQMLLEGQELEAYLAKEIVELPTRQRDALSLCYFEGLTCAEAARVMRVSVSAMEALLVRGRRTLRERLSQLHALSEPSAHKDATSAETLDAVAGLRIGGGSAAPAC